MDIIKFFTFYIVLKLVFKYSWVLVESISTENIFKEMYCEIIKRDIFPSLPLKKSSIQFIMPEKKRKYQLINNGKNTDMF